MRNFSKVQPLHARCVLLLALAVQQSAMVVVSWPQGAAGAARALRQTEGAAPPTPTRKKMTPISKVQPLSSVKPQIGVISDPA